MPVEELETLIRRAASGDARAFGHLVRRFQDMAVGYAYSLVGDFHLAEDAAQEAFAQAYKDLPLLRTPAAFPAWFRKLVFKYCDRLTRGQRLAITPLEAALAVPSEAPGPAEVFEVVEMRVFVRRALRALPERDRQVIALFYMADHSHKEIAAFLDVPVSAIKKRLHDARKWLKERILDMVQEDLRENRPSRDDRFVGQVLDLIAPDEAQHSEAIYRLFERPHQPHTLQWRQGRMAHSHLDWQASRIGCIDGEVVSAFGVYDIAMRIGTAQVRVAGLNLDAVHPDCGTDGEELTRRTARTAIDAMREQGYDLSVAFDDAAFYYEQGYVFGWRQMEWYVDTDELPTDPLDFELREFAPEHREDLAELYNRENKLLTGTAVRPTYLRNKHPEQFQGWYWTDERGEPAGYISGGAGIKFSIESDYRKDLDAGTLGEDLRQRLDTGFQDVRPPLSPRAVCAVQQEGERWLVVDARGGPRRQRRHLIVNAGDRLHVFLRERSLFWVDESAGDPVRRLQALGALARQYRCDSVYFDRLHYKSALGKRLRRMRTCQIQPDSHGGLRGSTIYVVRIVNLYSLCQNLAPELSHRLKNSPLADWTGDLLIAHGEEEVALSIKHSEIKVKAAGPSEHAIRGGGGIAQLVVGSETPDEIVEMNSIQLSGQAGHLIEVLFPAQYPQMENQAL